VSELWNKEDDVFSSGVPEDRLKEGNWEIFGEVLTELT
jgi:hypothetical protein